MAKNQTWLIRVDDVEHKVVFTLSFWTGRHTVTIDGVTTKFPVTFRQSFLPVDRQIFVGNKSCQLVVNGRSADIAIDGMYLNSQKPYQPIGKIPFWAWIFVVLCAMLVAGGGALPALTAMLGIMGCLRAATSPTATTGVKIGLCIGVTLLCWGFMIVLLLMTATLLAL